MVSLLAQNPRTSTLEYERYSIDSALIKVRQRLETLAANQGAVDYYTTLEEVLIAMDYAIIACQGREKAFDNLLSRVEWMEYSLAQHIRGNHHDRSYDARRMGEAPPSGESGQGQS